MLIRLPDPRMKRGIGPLSAGTWGLEKFRDDMTLQHILKLKFGHHENAWYLIEVDEFHWHLFWKNAKCLWGFSTFLQTNNDKLWKWPMKDFPKMHIPNANIYIYVSIYTHTVYIISVWYINSLIYPIYKHTQTINTFFFQTSFPKQVKPFPPWGGRTIGNGGPGPRELGGPLRFRGEALRLAPADERENMGSRTKVRKLENHWLGGDMDWFPGWQPVPKSKINIKSHTSSTHDGFMGQTVYLPTNLPYTNQIIHVGKCTIHGCYGV